MEKKNEIITREQAIKVIGNDEDGNHPSDTFLTESEFYEYVDSITNLTRFEAAKVMWPDHPNEQLEIINEILG